MFVGRFRSFQFHVVEKSALKRANRRYGAVRGGLVAPLASRRFLRPGVLLGVVGLDGFGRPFFALPTCPVPLICAFSGRKNDKLVKKQGGREQGSADGHGKQGGTGMGENGRAWGSVGPIGALHKAGKTW